MSDGHQVWGRERSYIFHFFLRPIPSIPHVHPDVENLPPTQVLTDTWDSSIWVAVLLDQHLSVLHRGHLGWFIFPLLHRYRRVLPLRLDLTEGGSATKRYCSGGGFRGTNLHMWDRGRCWPELRNTNGLRGLSRQKGLRLSDDLGV